MHDTSTTPSASAVTRRGLIRGAAWSVPAVTLATAAPAFANSGNLFVGGALGGADWDVVAIPTRLQVSGIRVRTSPSSATIPAGGLAVTVTFPNHFVRYLGDVDVVVEDVSYGWKAGTPSYFGSRSSRYATVTFTYQNALQPGGGLLTGGTTLLSFRAGRSGALTIQPFTDETPLPLTVSAAGFPPLTGLVVVVD